MGVSKLTNVIIHKLDGRETPTNNKVHALYLLNTEETNPKSANSKPKKTKSILKKEYTPTRWAKENIMKKLIILAIATIATLSHAETNNTVKTDTNGTKRGLEMGLEMTPNGSKRYEKLCKDPKNNTEIKTLRDFCESRKGWVAPNPKAQRAFDALWKENCDK